MKGQQHRIAMVIAALARAQSVLQAIEENVNRPISTEFMDKVHTYIESNTLEAVVDLASTERSIAVMQYFHKQKKFLAGYNNVGLVPSAAKEKDLAKRCLLMPGCNLTVQKVSRSTHKLSKEVQEAFTDIVNSGLGAVNKKMPINGGKVSIVLCKARPGNSMEESIEFTRKLSMYGITLAEYKKTLDVTENGNTQDGAIKRQVLAENVDPNGAKNPRLGQEPVYGE